MKSLFLLLALAPFAISAPVVLVKDSAPVGKIYIPATEEDRAPVNPKVPVKPLLQTAVEDLNYHIEKMTGTRLEVVKTDSPADVRPPAIVLGSLAVQSGADLKQTPNRDSVRIRTKDGKVLIAGEKESGTVHAMYTLLAQLGCDWVMPGAIGEIIPQTKTLAIPDLDISETPSFTGRNLWMRGSSKLNTEQDSEEFAEWRRRQRMDAPGETPNLGAGHVWGSLIKRHQDEFEKDPTMLALVRGPNGEMIRKGPQLETTHPRIAELFVEEIRAAFEKNKWPKDKEISFGIGPADGAGYSLSIETSTVGAGRIDPIMGEPDVTDACVLLGNQILERIEKEFPNVSLGYYAYSLHGEFPLRYKPHPRLNQIFAPINYSRFHSPLAKNSKTWPYYVAIVEKWGALAKEQGNKLSYRGYNWNLAENMIPFSKLEVYGEEIPWYHSHGFMSVNIEATKAWAVNGPSDYLLAKLMWNCDQDWKSVLDDYCKKSFGAGSEAMKTYLLDLTRRQSAAGQEAGSYQAVHLIYDEAFVDASRKLIEKAVADAKSPEEKTRAGYFLYPLEQLGLYLKFREAYTQFDFAKAAGLFQKIHESWESAYAANTQIVAKEVIQYLKRYLEAFVQESSKFSSPPYRRVLPLPDELKTQLDSTGAGELLGFQNPLINDSLFFKTRTWSAPWDAQGLGGYRIGAVWYRFSFSHPEVPKGEALGLFLGGADDQVKVWLNGKEVGSTSRKFSSPFVFDLSQAADPTGENVLVIKVTRISSMNEIGTGGLIRPSFLFVGPQVVGPQAAPRSEDRVLPGGEVEKSPSQ